MSETTAGDGDTTMKDQAANVAEEAKGAGARVGATAKEGASRVASEAAGQTKRLLTTAGGEVRERAAEQQQRAADGLRAVSRQLHEMADGSADQGVVAELVGQAGDRAESVAGFLADRDPGSLLAEVKSFARRRPGVFVAAALGAGILAGRLVKSIAATAGDAPETSGTGTSGVANSGGFPAATPTPAATPLYDETVIQGGVAP